MSVLKLVISHLAYGRNEIKREAKNITSLIDGTGINKWTLQFFTQFVILFGN